MLPLNQIPEGGTNPYANHPGFTAVGCPCQLTITQRNPYGAVTSGGFSCSETGGHCLPEVNQCMARVQAYTDRIEFLKRFDNALRMSPEEEVEMWEQDYQDGLILIEKL